MKLGRTGIALLGTLVVAGTALAHTGATGIVKDRMDAMSEIGDQVKAVGTMLKTGALDLPRVSEAGEVIANHGGAAMVKLFPEDSLHPPTEASPAIWTEWTKFQALADDLRSAALALKSTADEGGDKSQIAEVFGALGETCKSCHQAFRIKK
ncbi:cytochrome c [uncultured Roseibium sp.]|uniref:c-type cytochrome n=1 Tax=uncultured Roseibium sp. TaxID=1936171 RepID=UPI00262D33B8|nr:cytochrome c [uncultured Roseibium sp.]